MSGLSLFPSFVPPCMFVFLLTDIHCPGVPFLFFFLVLEEITLFRLMHLGVPRFFTDSYLCLRLVECVDRLSPTSALIRLCGRMYCWSLY